VIVTKVGLINVTNDLAVLIVVKCEVLYTAPYNYMLILTVNLAQCSGVSEMCFKIHILVLKYIVYFCIYEEFKMLISNYLILFCYSLVYFKSFLYYAYF